MAYIFFNPLLEGLSGKVGSALVVLLRSNMKNLRGLTPGGVVRSLGQHASFGQILTNVRKSFSLVAAAWSSATTVEKQSWSDAAASLQSQYGTFYSGNDYFQAYFMKLYGSQYGSGVNMASISAGVDWSYANRATVTWTAT